MMPLACSVTETTSASYKGPSSFRSSLAPHKGGPRRSLESSGLVAQVLATQVTSSADAQAQVSQPGSEHVRQSSAANAPPAWSRLLQSGWSNKFSSFWDRWQKLSTQLTQYSALRPDWVGQTQEMFDQQLQRFVTSVTTAASRQGPTALPKAAEAPAAASGRPTLTPYLTVADDVEVSFAAMLADLCNMAYEVDKINPDVLEARHRLSLIATSLTCGCNAVAAFDSGTEAEGPSSAPGTARHAASASATAATAARLSDRSAAEAAATGPSVVSFTMGGSPPLSPSISMVSLTSPEAVTAALTSQGHGAAFARPVYVSTLHHALTSMGSFDDEDDDILDLEWRAAVASVANAAHGPRTIVDIGSLGTIGTMGSVDEAIAPTDVQRLLASASAHQHPASAPAEAHAQHLAEAAAAAAAAAAEAEIQSGATSWVAGSGLSDNTVTPVGLNGATATMTTSATMDAAYTAAVLTSNATPHGLYGGVAAGANGRAAAAGMFFSNVPLNEERDFVSGHLYGYHTPLVERRQSSDGAAAAVVQALAHPAAADGAAAAAHVAETTLAGAAGGRALREEQKLRRRPSAGMLPMSGVTSGDDEMSAAAVGLQHGSMVATMTGTIEEEEAAAAVAAAAASDLVNGGAPVVVACTKAPPAAWFCSDDKLTRTRYFAIQGSTSLEHWQINLQFEPMVFEDEKYGVRIHRGVYEAAKVLYDDIVPLVQQHLETSPYATISFAGHSLGGSLGTVIMLLLVIRGVLKPVNISPVYTFGAPAVFCQGAVPDAPKNRCESCSLNCAARQLNSLGAAAANFFNGPAVDPVTGVAAGGPAGPACGCSFAPTGRASAAFAAPTKGGFGGLGLASMGMGLGGPAESEARLPSGLLARLGLSEDQVVNVIMHKDIVPRAFVCDYTIVAGALRRWVPSLKDHHYLQDDAPHKSLYNFVGRVAVVRPPTDLPFVNGPADAAHPMLPNLPALYRVGLHEDPILSPIDQAAATLASWDELLDSLSQAMSGACRRISSAAAASKRAAKQSAMQGRVMDFMNTPHPLTMLSDMKAYGPNGCISRFHNPDNYTRALYALSGRRWDAV